MLLRTPDPLSTFRRVRLVSSGILTKSIDLYVWSTNYMYMYYTTPVLQDTIGSVNCHEVSARHHMFLLEMPHKLWV